MSSKKQTALPTRGIRKLQQYLGSDEKMLVKPKTAKDLVPTLASEASHNMENNNTAQGLHADVLQHMEVCLSSGAARKLSGKQFKAVKLLGHCGLQSAAKAKAESSHESHEGDDSSQKLSVKRVVLTEEDMWHTIAVGALQRAAATHSSSALSHPSEPQRPKDQAPEENRAIFVLTSSAATARELADWLTSHYKLEVVLAADKEAAAFPVLPSSMQRGKARSRSRSPPPRSASRDQQTNATPHWAVPVVVASPEGFLATDQRSAVWRCVGVFVVATATAGKTKVLPAASELSKHRWSCLGHTPLTLVLASSEQAAVAPALDWLTTVRPVTQSQPLTLEEKNQNQNKKKNSQSSPLHRRPIQVYYHALEGMQRVQCLYGLLHGLQQGRGIVVRLATREMCTFLFDVLYRFLDALPPFLRLLSDYDGNSEYASTRTSEDRLRLAREFDDMVDAGRTSPVLLTCFGLVPSRGSIFLQYDLIENLPNFSNFIAEKVTPAASSTNPSVCGTPPPPHSHSSSASASGSGSGSEESSKEKGSSSGEGAQVVVVERTVSRKRSRSPRPMDRARGGGNSPLKATGSGESGGGDFSTVNLATREQRQQTTCYAYILVLLRPCEVKAALKHLSSTGERHSLTYAPLAKPPPLTRFLFVADKIRSMHRKLFAIQNAAYHAYKATMTVYCTLGPRDVYNEANLDLVKVAQEFGYEEVPLLDLRLKDTPFRPKEDYVKASRVKMAKARREHKAFAAEHIHGEGPAPLNEEA